MADCDPILHLIPNYSHGAEIGVHCGESSLAFLEKKSCRMLLVDPWEKVPGYDEEFGSGDALKLCLERLQGYTWKTWNCSLLRMCSVDAANAFVMPQGFDFVFIDGNHKYEFVKQDCEAWWRHVKAGGWLLGHDYNLQAFESGVKRAVDEFAAQKQLKATEHLATERGKLSCWAIKKPEVMQ